MLAWFAALMWSFAAGMLPPSALATDALTVGIPAPDTYVKSTAASVSSAATTFVGQRRANSSAWQAPMLDPKTTQRPGMTPKRPSPTEVRDRFAASIAV